MSNERGERVVGLDLRAPEAEEFEVEIVSIGDEPTDFDSGAPDSASGASPSARESESELARTLGAAQESYLRLRAEFENFRKRLEREREERERRALAGAFLDLLPVVDNLERAAHAKGSADDLKKGVELVARQLVEILGRYGLSEVPSVGQPFDPRLHEAVAREESAEHPAPTVIAELQRGYWLNERLLRPAMVRVAVPVESEPAPGFEADSGLASSPALPDSESEERS